MQREQAEQFLIGLRDYCAANGVTLYTCGCCHGLNAIPLGETYSSDGETSLLDEIKLRPNCITARFGPREKDGEYIDQERILIGEPDDEWDD